MLDKRSKIVLDTLIKNNYIYPQDKFVSLTDTLIPLLPPNKKHPWTWENLSPCIQYLLDCEYVSGKAFYHGEYPVPDYKYLYATYQGMNYKEFSRQRLKETIFKSVALPLVVALLTAFITTIVGYIWGMSSLSKRNANTSPIATPASDDISVTSSS